MVRSEESRGRRLRNIPQLLKACGQLLTLGGDQGSQSAGAPPLTSPQVQCVQHSFGSGWANDLQRMRDTDVLVDRPVETVAALPLLPPEAALRQATGRLSRPPEAGMEALHAQEERPC